MNMAGRVIPHRRGSAYPIALLQKITTIELPSKTERQTMHLLSSPVLANFYYVGGGSVGLLLVIVIVVLLVRR
jgi:hypothetical protein